MLNAAPGGNPTGGAKWSPVLETHMSTFSLTLSDVLSAPIVVRFFIADSQAGVYDSFLLNNMPLYFIAP